MLKGELLAKSPFQVLNPESGQEPDHRLGLVMALAGLGKTAVLAQIAMERLLRGYRVLHVSIGEGLEKTKTWYDDVFSHIINGRRDENTAVIEDELMRNRMIMTFRVSSFNRPKLEERLNDLVYQNIFRPDCIVIDGYDFASSDHAAVEDIRELMVAMNVQAWFSALRHRDDTRVSAAGVPAPCHEIDDLFNTVILLEPEKDAIYLNIIKDNTGNVKTGKALSLDPSTMMVREF